MVDRWSADAPLVLKQGGGSDGFIVGRVRMPNVVTVDLVATDAERRRAFAIRTADAVGREVRSGAIQAGHAFRAQPLEKCGQARVARAARTWRARRGGAAGIPHGQKLLSLTLAPTLEMLNAGRVLHGAMAPYQW